MDIPSSLISSIPSFVLMIIIIVPLIWSIIWGYKDAKLRGKQPILVASLVALLSWPVSLLVWLVFRPDKKR